MKWEATLLDSFYEASITLIPNTDKESRKGKLQTNIVAKIFDEILTNRIQWYIKKNTPWPSGVYSRYTGKNQSNNQLY